MGKANTSDSFITETYTFEGTDIEQVFARAGNWLAQDVGGKDNRQQRIKEFSQIPVLSLEKKANGGYILVLFCDVAGPL